MIGSVNFASCVFLLLFFKFRHSQGDKKTMRHLAELNYSKAAALFMQLENPIDILKVQLDQAVLIEDQMSGE